MTKNAYVGLPAKRQKQQPNRCDSIARALQIRLILAMSRYQHKDNTPARTAQSPRRHEIKKFSRSAVPETLQPFSHGPFNRCTMWACDLLSSSCLQNPTVVSGSNDNHACQKKLTSLLSNKFHTDEHASFI